MFIRYGSLLHMKYRNSILLLVFTVWSHIIFAQNPIVKDIGMSDPHVRVFNDTLYLYSGHDASPTDKTWVMKDWRVFSTTDLIHWAIRDTIRPIDNYMDDSSTDCWASDAATRNGKYYFYFSDHKRGVGVMVSDSPTGPFKDALGKALVSPMHDPTVFMDDDKQKTPYLIYGDKAGGGFHIAALNDDMISLSERPKPIQIRGKEWEHAPEWMDKNYLFKHGDTYYLSWGRDYAISKDIYGPYESVGSVGNGHNLNEFAHGSFFGWKGQMYHIWCYYIKQGYKFRESIITYCHFDEDGKIVTDTGFLDAHFANGVGQYNASWNTIEAEWYYEISEGITKKGNKEKGFVLTHLRHGDWVRFANVTFDKAFDKFVANASLKGKKGRIEIRMGSPEGDVLGKVKLRPAAAVKEFKGRIKDYKGTTDLYLVFKGGKGSTAQVDYIKFE